jgi:hypothetical protein
LGATGEDYVGSGNQLSPNGNPDWHIQLHGLRGSPTTVRITSNTGIWESPFNGANWVILPQYSGANADLWFEPWPSQSFHVQVWYSDGSTDEADAGSSTAPPNTGAFKAFFLGVTGQDFVGEGNQLSPNGNPDWHIQLQGLRGIPTAVRITSDNGLWEGPFNGTNWVILPQYDAAGNADLWFEPWASPSFHVTVWYSDGSTDEADVASSTGVSTTSTLKAFYLGVTGQDYVGSWGQLSPNGNPDWHIQLHGLRGTPTTVRITSAVGGVWESPFSGEYWVNLPQYDGAGNADLWFEPWASPTFHVTVWYSDGSTDESNAL